MKQEKVLVVTSKARGGIAQFALSLAHGVLDNPHTEKVYLMVPSDSEYSSSERMNVFFYDKVKMSNPKEEKFAKIIGKIEGIDPDYVIFAEASVFNMQLANFLKGKFHISMVIHDALLRVKHLGWKDYFRGQLFSKTLKKSISTFDKLIVLSFSVREELYEKYPESEGKVLRIRLCSSLNVAKEAMTENMIGGNYFLFFGRINQSKGLKTLFEAYEKDTSGVLPKLVVAGSGEFTRQEQYLLDKLGNKVVVMKKYITDEMLASLMSYSSAVILPYFEATQSGIIPMAYQFKKPVIVSNLKGLLENMVESETGFIFTAGNYNELYGVLKKVAIMGDDLYEMVPKIEAFYDDKYDWERNVDKLVSALHDNKKDVNKNK